MLIEDRVFSFFSKGIERWVIIGEYRGESGNVWYLFVGERERVLVMDLGCLGMCVVDIEKSDKWL